MHNGISAQVCLQTFLAKQVQHNQCSDCSHGCVLFLLPNAHAALSGKDVNGFYRAVWHFVVRAAASKL